MSTNSALKIQLKPLKCHFKEELEYRCLFDASLSFIIKFYVVPVYEIISHTINFKINENSSISIKIQLNNLMNSLSI